LIIITIMIWLS